MSTSTSTRVELVRDNPLNLDRLRPETRAAIEHAAFILVPDAGFGDYDGPVFPQGTMELFTFLREHAPADQAVDLAVEDADYHEVAVHFNIVRLATIFVEYVAAPIVTNMIAGYLMNRLGSKFKSAEVRSALVVRRKASDGEKTLRYSYEGPAITYEQTMNQVLASIAEPTALPPSADIQQPSRAGNGKRPSRRKK